MTTTETDLLAEFGQIRQMVERVFAQGAIADEVAAKLGAAHPEQADLLWHAAEHLCQPTHPLMATEAVYRAHVTEILGRVVAGKDTRPGTDAELACAFATFSPHNHMSPAGNALYARVFARIMPEQAEIIGIDPEQWEWTAGASEVDHHERQLRARAAQKWRIMPKAVECYGTHDGQPVSCRFASGTSAPGGPRSRPRSVKTERR